MTVGQFVILDLSVQQVNWYWTCGELDWANALSVGLLAERTLFELDQVE